MRKILILTLTLAFVHVLHGAVLECDFSSGGCVVKSITDVTSPNQGITVKGQPADFADNKTYSLSFQNPSRLLYIPTGVFKIFRAVQAFSMHNNSLTNLVPNAFTDCGFLMTITLTQNNFPTLSSSFASTCINVTSLYLIQNNIQNVDMDAFKGLKFLNQLILRDNQISCIPPDAFRHTPVIQNIDLYNNQITKLDPATFRRLPNLNTVMLGNNKIASIPAFDLEYTGMSMMFNLMFETNQIQAINPQFVWNVFAERAGYTMSSSVSFYDFNQNSTSCIPKNNMHTQYISNYGWPMSDISLSACYANWNAEIENRPVSCAP